MQRRPPNFLRRPRATDMLCCNHVLLCMCASARVCVCSGRHPKSTSLQCFSLAARRVPTQCTHLFAHNKFLGNYIWPWLSRHRIQGRLCSRHIQLSVCVCVCYEFNGECVLLSQQSRTVTFGVWTEGPVRRTAASARKATLEITADNVRKKITRHHWTLKCLS